MKKDRVDDHLSNLSREAADVQDFAQHRRIGVAEKLSVGERSTRIWNSRNIRRITMRSSAFSN
jgi:hypothetical protein